MATFVESWDLGDVTFVVESGSIFANRAIMSMWSPVMKVMFRGDFRERTAVTVELPGKRFDDVLELVRVLHPPNRDVDGDNVTILLPMAREYQIDDLTRRCEQFLLAQTPSVRSLALAEEFSLKTLEMQCVMHVQKSTLLSLLEEDGFELLSDDTRIRILLEKATKYEEVLRDVSDVIAGNRPEQMRFRSAGTLCTFTCSDKEFCEGVHNAGTEKSCKSCAVTMTKNIAGKLDKTYFL